MVVIVRLKGLNHSTKRLANGTTVTYWYAWRDGPRLPGAPGSPEFLQAYAEAHKNRKRPPGRSLGRLVALYLDSPEWSGKAKSTQREWRRWLDRIRDGKLGSLPYAALDDSKVRKHFIAWRNGWKTTARSADYAMQVLSALLSWAVEQGEIENNFAARTKHLYRENRAEVIWSDAEVAAYRKWAPSPEAGFIVPLACLTGLRREDLANLLWSEVGDVAIVKATSKSRGRKTAAIPILPETRELLGAIRALQSQCDGNVLLNTRGKPWTTSGLTHAVAAFRGKRLHDCRGTFATRLRLAGLKASEIADAMGWEENRVERLLSVYVDRERIVKELSNRISNRQS